MRGAGSNPASDTMIIEVGTGILGMVGMDASFKVECYEKSCKKCVLRFKCYTTRDTTLKIDMDDWFKVNKKIKHKILV